MSLRPFLLRRLCRRWLQSVFRFHFSLMASRATDGTIAAIVFVQNVVDHGEHIAGGLFGRYIIFLPMVLDVAMGTLHSQRLRKEIHDKRELAGRNTLQALNVMKHFF